MIINYFINQISYTNTIVYRVSSTNIYSVEHISNPPQYHSKLLLFCANNPLKFNLFYLHTQTLKELYEVYNTTI